MNVCIFKTIVGWYRAEILRLRVHLVCSNERVETHGYRIGFLTVTIVQREMLLFNRMHFGDINRIRFFTDPIKNRIA